MQKKAIVLFVLLAIGWVLGQRPINAFIFRGVLPSNKNRMIIVVLNQSLTAIYDGTSSSLYQIWDDVPENGNATYGHREWGSTFEPPNGSIRTTISTSNPWEVGGQSANIRYMGYSLRGDTATLKYRITLPNNAVIQIIETPEYQSASGGGIALQRRFSFSGIPQGTTLRLLLSGNGSNETWEVTGTGSTSNSGGNDYLNQNVDGESIVTGTWR